MSQRAHENLSPKHAPTSEKRRHEPSGDGLSPDDSIDVKVGTGQPPQQPDPPEPPR
jgi:hypothetical protein